MPISDGYEAFVPAVPGNRASLLWSLWGGNGHLTSRASSVDSMELDQVSPWGLTVISMVAEKMAEWRHDVVQSWHKRRWSLTV
jgi:hypothetical protein